MKYFNVANLITETIYGFDNASRLLEMKHLDSLNIELEVLNYLYDANSNRTTMNRPSVTLPMPNQASNTSYNEANQMLSFNDKNIVYDNNGNMTSVTNSCGTTNYTWDARNRLVGINGFNTDCSSLTASFKYDALNRRIEKTINGTTTQYVYDGVDIIQEKQGMVITNYIRTLNIDEPLARIKSDGAVRYYQQDALGSVIALTDENGVIKTQYTYDPFGAVTISGESSDNPFQFAGRENDGNGHLFERNRYYSYELLRYISEDPIGFAGGDVNLYVRVWNNPILFTDPYGLFSLKDALKNPKVTAIVSLGASKLAEYAATKMEPGKARGAVYLVSAGLATTSALEAIKVAAASYVLAVTTVETGVSPLIAMAMGIGFTGLAIYDINLASEYFWKAIEDFKYKEPCK